MFSAGHSRRAPACLFWSHAEGTSSRRRHRPAVRDDRSGAGRVVRRDGRAPDRKSPTSSRRTPTSRSVTSAVGTYGARRTRAQVTIDLKPIGERHAQRRARSSRDLRRSVDGRPGHRRVHAESAGDLDRRPRVEEPLPVHDAERRHRRRCIRPRASIETRLRQLPILHDVTSDLLIGNPQVTDRDRPRARGRSASRRSRSRSRSTMRTASGRSRRSTRRTTSTGS